MTEMVKKYIYTLNARPSQLTVLFLIQIRLKDQIIPHPTLNKHGNTPVTTGGLKFDAENEIQRSGD